MFTALFHDGRRTASRHHSEDADFAELSELPHFSTERRPIARAASRPSLALRRAISEDRRMADEVVGAAHADSTSRHG